jgi:uracil-DNA glycosylase
MKRNSGWKSILRSAECRGVLAQVAALRKKGERVYPTQKDVFRAFEDCPFKQVRVVILGQDPYANEGQAIGRALPCRNRNRQKCHLRSRTSLKR